MAPVPLRPFQRPRVHLCTVGVYSVRTFHGGHVKATMRKMGLPRDKWLDHVEQAPRPSVVKRMKDSFAREKMMQIGEIGSLFGEEEKLAILDPKRLSSSSSTETTKRSREDEVEVKQRLRKQQEDQVHDALRMYRILKPDDALPFFKEDALTSLQSRMARQDTEHSGLQPTVDEEGQRDKLQVGNEFVDPFQLQLPVVNPTAFMIALDAATRSLADDLEYIAKCIGVHEEELPALEHPERFKLLVDAIFNAFPLRKDPSYVDDFMRESWPRLKVLLPTELLAHLSDADIASWLRAHLTRVAINQRTHSKIWQHSGADKAKNVPHDQNTDFSSDAAAGPRKLRTGDEEWYSFAEDFVYDSHPVDPKLVDERNMSFPLEKAGEYMSNFLAFMGLDKEKGVQDVSQQFQGLVWSLDKIGLRNWLKMDVQELEEGMPKGGPLPVQDVKAADVDVAKVLLRCAARGKANLLDFDAVDPYKLLHGFPTASIQEELAQLPPNPFLADSEIDLLIDVGSAGKRLKKGNNDFEADKKVKEFMSIHPTGATPVEAVVQSEVDWYKSAGPVHWQGGKENGGLGEWKWKKPSNTMYDERRGVYVRQKSGVDPNINLSEMRQHMIDVGRMGSMCKDGRLYYFRALVVVGNGKGVYGFGCGFGNTVKDAKSDASLKALQRLQVLDYDKSRTLPYPIRTREYTSQVTLVPRKIGLGCQSNRKHLPIMYVLGLDNMRMKFRNNKWYSRLRALQRALEQIQSRRTLANGTGKKYAHMVAPGDHWVHWADRWFQEIRKPYDAKKRWVTLHRRHELNYKKKSGRFLSSPHELKAGWTQYAWKNPLMKWSEQQRKVRNSRTQISEFVPSKFFPSPVDKAALIDAGEDEKEDLLPIRP